MTTLFGGKQENTYRRRTLEIQYKVDVFCPLFFVKSKELESKIKDIEKYLVKRAGVGVLEKL